MVNEELALRPSVFPCLFCVEPKNEDKTMKGLKWSVLVGCLMLALSLQAQDSDKEWLKIGDPMPAINLQSEVYGNITPDDLKGKVVMVSLFATWCPPCQLELAEVQKTLYPKYKDNPDFKLLVIGREHTDADLSKYNERKKFTFPLYPDPKRKVFSLFADQTIPRTYLFGKDGKLVYASTGYNAEEFQKLMSAIETAVQK